MQPVTSYLDSIRRHACNLSQVVSDALSCLKASFLCKREQRLYLGNLWVGIPPVIYLIHCGTRYTPPNPQSKCPCSQHIIWTCVVMFVEGQFVRVAFHHTWSGRLGVRRWHLSWSNCSSARVPHEASQHYPTYCTSNSTTTCWEFLLTDISFCIHSVALFSDIQNCPFLRLGRFWNRNRDFRCKPNRNWNLGSDGGPGRLFRPC